MKDKFPIEGPSAVVTKDMCDLNNHMNVVYYQHIFEDGCYGFFSDMGFTAEYFEEGYSSFTLETDIPIFPIRALGNPFVSFFQVSPPSTVFHILLPFPPLLTYQGSL